MANDILEVKSPPPAVDIRRTTPDRNFGSGASARAIWASQGDSPGEEGLETQEAAYYRAREVAELHKIERIVAIGHVLPDMFRHVFRDEGYRLGVIRPPRSAEKTEKTEIPVRECHLDYYPSIQSSLEGYADEIPTLYILSDLIGRLADPRPILRGLRKNLKRHRESRLIITTQSRRTIRRDPNGLPRRADSIREWSLKELTDFIASSGFSIEKQRYTGPDGPRKEKRSCWLEVSCSDDFFSRFLAENGLPEENGHVILTSEHIKARGSGWIGVYAGEAEAVAARRPLIFFTGSEGDIPIDLRREWIFPGKMVCTDARADIGDMVLDAFLQMVFFYDGIRLLEMQDYMGHGYRIAQAKKAGLIPGDILLKVTCHGSHALLENARKYWTPRSGMDALYQEKELIEKADLVSFPSRFSRDLYLDEGYEIDKEIDIGPYCFDYTSNYADTASDIGTLIFFGGHGTTESCRTFVELLKGLRRRGLVPARIKKALLIGENLKDVVGERYINDLDDVIEIECYDGEVSGAIDLISSLGPESLCILPYGGDNYPMSVLKVIDSCCPLLAADNGGIEEFVPDFYRPFVLTGKSRQEITDGILRYLEIDNEQRKEIVNGLKRSVAQRQEKINKAYREKNRELQSRNADGFPDSPVSGQLVSVIVPLFNTDFRYLRDLSVSLNNQTIWPKEVIFVDDGSRQGYGEDAQRTIARVLKIPFRMIRQDNTGASGAKNTAWKNATTKYIIALDSDNMLKPDFIYKTVAFMERSPDCPVVTTYLDTFNDGDNFEDQRSMVSRYRPKYGSIILGQLQNIFGDNIGCYRRDVLQEVGGWDEYGKVKEGDWAFYLNLTCRGYKTGIINESLALYRLREDSAIVRMDKYISDRCIARNNVCLPRFEAYSLHRICRDYGGLLREIDHLQQTLEMMRQQHARLSYRITRKVPLYAAKDSHAGHHAARDTPSGPGAL